MSTSQSPKSQGDRPAVSLPKGRFIAVVGPSGAGKDSVMEGICAARPKLLRVRRAITRDADAGGEDFEAVSPQTFADRVSEGAFAVHWQAHGLSYGIPTHVHDTLELGQDALANLSRGMLETAADVFGTLVVLHITAPQAVLSARLTRRGREPQDAIARRLSRPAAPLPSGLSVIEIDNSGPLELSINAALAALYPESG